MKLKRLLFPLLTLLLVLLLIPRAQAEEVATSAKACIIIDESSGQQWKRELSVQSLLSLYLLQLLHHLSCQMNPLAPYFVC